MLTFLFIILVQYYKGAALLWHLENTVGSSSKFDEFLRCYINEFSRKILNTDDFVRYFESYFPNVSPIDWNSWLYTPGMPPIQFDFSTELEKHSRRMADRIGSVTKDEIQSLNPKQIAFLLNLLLNRKDVTPFETIDHLHNNCGMSNYSNCEIRFQWYQLCIRIKYESVLEDIFQFLKVMGRMKFVKPLYVEFKASWPQMMGRVRQFFEEQKQFMNPITVKQIELRIKDD